MTALDIIKHQFQLRIYEESRERIIKVLDMLSEDEVWYRPNDHANTIGNLILHLCGNVTQWIGYGIGGTRDHRLRDAEFDITSRISKANLKQKLQDLEKITDQAMTRLAHVDQLIEPCTVQGFEETKLGVIIHVIEHFSYHTGQIAMIAKYIRGTALGFYEDMNLNVTGD